MSRRARQRRCTGAQPAPQPAVELDAGPSLLARLPDLGRRVRAGGCRQDQPPSWAVETPGLRGLSRRAASARRCCTPPSSTCSTGCANLIRGQVTARITPKTWWANMEHGWVWDLDDFVVNQIGHPYQGNNYFNAGRSNGLSFYESAAVTAFGSGTWEYFGETNKRVAERPHQHDAGRHRARRDVPPRRPGSCATPTRREAARLWSEIGATVARPDHRREPVHLGRCIARRLDKPADMVPSSLGGFIVRRRALARHRRPARSTRPASRFSRWTCSTGTRRPGAAGRPTTRSR